MKAVQVIIGMMYFWYVIQHVWTTTQLYHRCRRPDHHHHRCRRHAATGSCTVSDDE